jgi:hypothetical protein
MPQLPRHRRAWIIAAAMLSLGVAAWQNAHHVHVPAIAQVHEHCDGSHPEHSRHDDGAGFCDLCLQFSRLPAPPDLSIPPPRHDLAWRLATTHPPRAPRTEQISDAHRARGPPAARVTVA